MKQDNGEQQRSTWTQQLHDKLADHETPAPADLWADIEAALPKQPRKARFMTLRRWAAAAAVAALLGGGAIVWWGQEYQHTESLVSMVEELYTEEPQETELQHTESQEPALQHTELQEPALQDVDAPLPCRGGARGGVTNSTFTHTAQATNKEKERRAQTPPPTPPLEGRGEEMESTKGKEEEMESTTVKPRPRRMKRQPAIGLYAMNGLGSQDNSNGVMMTDALANMYTSTYDAGQPASRRAPIYLTGYEEHQHHYQPVAFGLTLSYPFTERLSLTSGVVYTQLKSEFTQVIHSQHIVKRQTLYYIGVPLSVNYRLWQYKDLKVYLAAGMQADWNVKAQVKTEGVEQETGLDRLQWSVNGSIGLQYRLLPQLSLYAEPGINHYFDNGSKIENYFKNKPTSLKLQVGVRLDLQK